MWTRCLSRGVLVCPGLIPCYLSSIGGMEHGRCRALIFMVLITRLGCLGQIDDGSSQVFFHKVLNAFQLNVSCAAFHIQLRAVVVVERLAIRPECTECCFGCEAVNPSVSGNNGVPCFPFLVRSIKLRIYERYLESGFSKGWKHCHQEYAWYGAKDVSRMGDCTQCLLQFTGSIKIEMDCPLQFSSFSWMVSKAFRK